MFHPIQARKVHEAAVEQIADAIRSGRLRIGDRLPSERALTAEMEISRPSLREAVRVLADAGLLEVRRGPHGGMFVLSDAVPADLLAERDPLRWSEVARVLEARRATEPRVAQLAALHISPDDVTELRRIIALQRETLDNHERSRHLDMQFHLALAEATHNETIVAMMRMLFSRLALARDRGMRERLDPAAGVELHEETLAAILAGDPAAIDDVMDRHLRLLEGMWADELADATLRPLPPARLPG